MAHGAFFRFSIDETSIHQFFSHAKEHFKHYNQPVAQQDWKIEELADQLAPAEVCGKASDRRAARQSN
jgi:hypothetical protein